MKKELAEKLGEIVALLLMEGAEDEAPKTEQGMMPQAAQMPPPNYQAVGGPPRPAARQVAPPGTPPAPMADLAPDYGPPCQPWAMTTFIRIRSPPSSKCATTIHSQRRTDFKTSANTFFQ